MFLNIFSKYINYVLDHVFFSSALRNMVTSSSFNVFFLPQFIIYQSGNSEQQKIQGRVYQNCVREKLALWPIASNHIRDWNNEMVTDWLQWAAKTPVLCARESRSGRKRCRFLYGRKNCEIQGEIRE